MIRHAITYGSGKGVPQVRMQYVPNAAPPPAPPIPPLPFYFITGTVAESGSPLAINLEVDGVGTITSAVATGSYGFYVLSGYSGTVLPHFGNGSFTPVSRVYSSVGSDYFNQDYDLFRFSFIIDGNTYQQVGPTLYTFPGVPVEFTGIGTIYTDGSAHYNSPVPHGYTGTAIPHYTGGTFSPTLRTYTNVVSNPTGQDFTFYGTTLYYAISGTVAENGTGLGAALEVTGIGTTFSDPVTGSYTQPVPYGYTGTIVPHLSGGTFSPSYRNYFSVNNAHPNDNYAFYGTTPSGECPIPGPLTPITLPLPNDASFNVMDPVNNLLWVVDESNTNVYYADVVAGTFAGSVDINCVFGSPCIAYDSANQKILVTTYDGSLAFINPVTKAVTFSNFKQRWPNLHLLAVSEAGTAFVCDNRMSAGYLYVVDCASETLLSRYPLVTGAGSIFTDAICFAENIQQLVINQDEPGGPRFFLFDPSNGNFAASVILSGGWSFNYENYYDKTTGHLLMTQSGFTAPEVLDIANGINATVIDTLAGGFTRLNAVTEDTCAGRLFVNDGNYAVYEFTNDGNYDLINQYNDNGAGLNPNGLAHSRKTNKVYYENYNDGTIYSLKATASGTTFGQAVITTSTLDPGAVITWNGSTGVGTVIVTSGGTNPGDFGVNNTVDAFLTVINLGAPYAASVQFVYTSQINNSGTIDFNGQAYWSDTLGAVGDTNSVVTNGTFSGSSYLTTMIGVGYSYFEIYAQAQSGGNFTASPAQAFTRVTGTFTLAPL